MQIQKETSELTEIMNNDMQVPLISKHINNFISIARISTHRPKQTNTLSQLIDFERIVAVRVHVQTSEMTRLIDRKNDSNSTTLD